MQVTYGNPSAKHMKGIEAENKVKAAQELIAKTLRAKPKEILFTSGGTESNNTAIIGTGNGKSPQRKAHYYDKGRTMLLYMNQCIIWKKKDMK